MKIGRSITTQIATHAAIAAAHHEHTLAEDMVDSAVSALDGTDSGVITMHRRVIDVPGESDVDLATVTPTFAAISFGVAVAVVQCYAVEAGGHLKLRLYMDGVMVDESVALVTGTTYVLVGTKALSGAKECKVAVHNSDTSSRYIHFGCLDSQPTKIAAGIGVGSITE